MLLRKFWKSKWIRKKNISYVIGEEKKIEEKNWKKKTQNMLTILRYLATWDTEIASDLFHDNRNCNADNESDDRSDQHFWNYNDHTNDIYEHF